MGKIKDVQVEHDMNGVSTEQTFSGPGFTLKQIVLNQIRKDPLFAFGYLMTDESGVSTSNEAVAVLCEVEDRESLVRTMMGAALLVHRPDSRELLPLLGASVEIDLDRMKGKESIDVTLPTLSDKEFRAVVLSSPHEAVDNEVFITRTLGLSILKQSVVIAGVWQAVIA